MPFLKRAARFRAHAVACLAAADDAVTSRAHLAMAKHFHALAEQELSQREARRRGFCVGTVQSDEAPHRKCGMINAGGNPLSRTPVFPVTHSRSFAGSRADPMRGVPDAQEMQNPGERPRTLSDLNTVLADLTLTGK
jgi:hypothetical protein